MMAPPRNKSFFLTPARTVFRSARGIYRGARSLKNWSLNRLDPPIVILVYHRVAELASDPEMIAVSPENFHQQMEYLKQNHPVLRIDDDWSDRTAPGVVITFDDGYADNYLKALPILEKIGIPATFYVSTGLIGTTKEFWWNRMESVLLRKGVFPSTFSLADSRYGRTLRTETIEDRENLYAELSLLMRKLNPARQEDWLRQLETWAGADVSGGRRHRCLNHEEIKALSESPWATIGAHTVTHAALSVLPEDQQREEIFSSKRHLEEMIGRKVETFSYPFGRRCDYNRASVRFCREAGFRRVASNFPGQVHQWTDPMQLPRHLVRNWDLETFAAEMKRFWTR